MKLDIILLTIITSIYIACGQNDYELEFLEESIFTPCENYPDNYIDKLFDVSNAHIEQTDDGSLVVNGYTLVKRTVDGALPLTVEAFKKERGTWQPTLFTQKRDDTCTACFSKSELWHNYLKNTPEEQLTCPFTEGQRYDFDINEPTYMSLPIGNADGEYKVHVMAGSENDDFFICTEIHAMVYKI